MRVAIIPGDGIGKEVTAEAVKVLTRVGEVFGRQFQLEHLPWSADYFLQTGITIPPPHESRHWRPEELPGRRPFDAARSILGSRVEPVVGDFMTMDLAGLDGSGLESDPVAAANRRPG